MATAFPLTPEASALLDRLLAFDGWFAGGSPPPAVPGFPVRHATDWPRAARLDADRGWVNQLNEQNNALLTAEREARGTDWYQAHIRDYVLHLHGLVRPAADRALAVLSRHVDLKKATRLAEWVHGNLTSCVREAQTRLHHDRPFYRHLAEVYLAGYLPYGLDGKDLTTGHVLLAG